MRQINSNIYKKMVAYGVSCVGSANEGLVQCLGYSPALKNEFFPIGALGFDEPKWAKSYVDQTSLTMPGASIMLTLEPFKGLEVLTPASYLNIAMLCRVWKAKGLNIFLRFAHEMNGAWYRWGMKPVAYIKAFRGLANAVGDSAKMVWAPNVAYNKDMLYLDFYPGDEYVDWVGLSLYNFESSSVPKQGLFLEKLTSGGKQNFYDLFCVKRGKPMMIAETSAPTPVGMSSERDLELKRAWWSQLYSREVSQKYPQLKIIAWFDVDKREKNYGIFTRNGKVVCGNLAKTFIEDLKKIA